MNAVTKISAPAQGQGLQFNNVDGEAVTIAHDAALSPANWTVEAWIETTDASADFNRVLTKAVGGAQTYSLVVKDGNFFVLSGALTTFGDTGVSVADGQPHHIAASYDATAQTISAYVDGVLVSTFSAPNALPQGTEDVFIGDYPAPFVETFDGVISDVRIWSDVRTEQEIADNFDQTLAPGTANLEAYLTFDGDVLDQSGNGRDGTIVGALAFVESAAPVDAPVQADEDVAQAITSITVSDIDAGNVATVTLSVATGVLELGSSAGLSFEAGANGSPTFTVRGSVADLNNALATLTYTGNADFNGADAINVSVTDNGAIETSNITGSQTVPNDGAFLIHDFDTGVTTYELRTGGVTEPTSAPENGIAVLLNPNNNNFVVNAFVYTDGVLSFGDPNNFAVSNYTGGGGINNDDLGPGFIFNDAFSNQTLTYTQPDFPTPEGDRALTIAVNGVTFFDTSPGNVPFASATSTLGLSDTGLGEETLFPGGAQTVPNAGFFYTYDFDTGVANIEARVIGNPPSVVPTNGVFLGINPNNTEWSANALIYENGVETVGNVNAFAIANYGGSTAISGDAFVVNDVTTNATLTWTDTIPTPGGMREVTFTFDGVDFTDAPPGEVQIDRTTFFQAATATQAIAINVSPTTENAVAEVTSPATVTGNEDAAIAITGVTVADADAGAVLMVSLSVTSGTLNLASTAGLTITAGANDAAMITVEGTVADLNAALATLTYTGDQDFNGADDLTIVVNDGLPDQEEPVTGSLTVNDVGQLFAFDFDTGAGASAELDLVNGNPGFPPANGVQVFINPDAGQVFVLAAFVENGAQTFIDPATFVVAGYAGASSVVNNDLILSDSITGADLTITASVPTPGGMRDVTFDFSGIDFTDNSTGTLQLDASTVTLGATATQAVSVNVSAANDVAEVVTPATATGDEDASIAISGVTVSDVDAGDVLTVTLSVATGALNLSSTTGLTITGGANDTATITVEGLATDLNAALATLSYTGDPDFNGADDLIVVVNDGGADEVSGVTGAENVPGSGTYFIFDFDTGIGFTEARVGTTPPTAEPNNGVVILINPNGTQTRATALTYENGVRSDGDASGFALANYAGTTQVATAEFGDNFQINDDVTGGVLTWTRTDLQTPGGARDFTFTFDNVNFNDSSGVFTIGGSDVTLGAETIATTPITIDPVNDAPVLTAPATATGNEDAPIAISGVSVADVDVAEGTGEVAVTLGVTSGDLTLGTTTGVAFSGGANGQATFTITGQLADVNAALATLSYQGDQNFNGQDDLTVSVTDLGNSGAPGALTGAGVIALTINPVNDAPVITQPGFFFGDEDTVFDFSGISIADVDVAEGNNILDLTLTVNNGVLAFGDTTGLNFFTAQTGANVSFFADIDDMNAALTTLTYTPNPDFNGFDDLTIDVFDGNGPGDPEFAFEFVSIDVQAVNDAPILTAPASASGDEDAAIAISGISIADVDVGEGGGDVSVTLTVSNGALTLGTVTGLSFSGGANGDASFTITGQLANVNAALATLSYQGAPDFNGTDSLSVTVSDNGNTGLFGAETDAATVPITVSAVNDAPVAVDDQIILTEDGPVSGDLISFAATGPDSDLDGDMLTIVEIDGQPFTPGAPIVLASGALLLVDPNGAFTLDPNGEFETLAAAEPASFSFTYTISDNAGGFATATAFVTIDGVNDAPLAGDDSFATIEDAPVSGDVILGDGAPGSTDQDIDALDLLSVIEIDGQPLVPGAPLQLAAGGLLTISDTGAFTYNPNGDFEALGVGEAATVSFAYTISDGNGGVSSATASILVEGVNDAPTAGDDDASTDEDNAVSGQLISGPGLDSDIESDLLSIAAINGAAFTPGAPITLASGAILTVALDGSFDYDPNGAFESLAVGDIGQDEFTYTVSDGQGGTADADVSITINGVNDAPVAQREVIVANEDDIARGVLDGAIGVPAADVDGDDLFVSALNGQSLNPARPAALGSGATLSVDENGEFVFSPNGAYENLNAGDSVTETFTYTVSDGNGGETTAEISVTILGRNELFNGTAGTDTPVGAGGTDVMFLRGGRDFAAGRGGDDMIVGGFGDDFLRGGLGDDRLIGGGDDDRLFGERGDDTLRGEDGADRLLGQLGDDLLTGGAGIDTIGGGFGDDVLGGDGGADKLFGAFGDDRLLGGAGDDLLAGGAGDDTLLGGQGADNLVGGRGADVFLFFGNAGVDAIRDFEDGVDRLEFVAADTFGQLTITDTSDGAVVRHGQVSVLLENFEASDLTRDDFIF